MLPAVVLQPKPGERVLDMCAAPGGKATHIAALMENKGQVTACDIYPHKLKLIEDNAKRLKLDIIKTELQDGTVLREEWIETFDRVLVDAPCSNTGVLRRRPDARWNWDGEKLAVLIRMQRHRHRGIRRLYLSQIRIQRIRVNRLGFAITDRYRIITNRIDKHLRHQRTSCVLRTSRRQVDLDIVRRRHRARHHKE